MSTDIPIPVVVAPRLREGAKSLMRTLGCDLICRGVCQVGVFGRVRWAGVWVGGREAGASGSVSALPVVKAD
jgi:hypothetical protein